MVVMEPISQMNNKPARTKRTFTFRPYTEDRLQQMQTWIDKENWSEISRETSAHKKMELLQTILLGKYQEYFPEKSKTIRSDDQPFYTSKLENLKRRKSREFHKRRKSNKWIIMNKEYEVKLDKSKKDFYRKKIKKLRKVKSKKYLKNDMLLMY